MTRPPIPTPGLVPFHDELNAVLQDAQDTLDSAANPQGALGQDMSRAQILPYLSPLTELVEPLRRVMIQREDGTVYACYSRTGAIPNFEKSTDGGTTWTQKISALPVDPKVIYRLVSGTIILVESTATTTPGGSNPRLYRSTDDGASWTLIVAGLRFPPLYQGICEGTDGSVMIAEYGNVTLAYRVMRSTDDGVTWGAVLTTAGVEPPGDPGHLHSITYDPVAAKHVVISDRPIDVTYGGPKVYSSSDNGATWSEIGISDDLSDPNFVAPMYFDNYVGWVSDNQLNGHVYRMPRADFYSGNWGASELVAQLNPTAAYYTFPLRDDAWLVCQKTEHITSSEQETTLGSYASPVHVVDQEGARVGAGVESYYATAAVGVNPAVSAFFPSYDLGIRNHDGICWVNMAVGLPRPYAATPVTQGWATPKQRVQLRAIPLLKYGLTFNTLRAGVETPIVSNIFATYVAVGPNASSGTADAHIRMNDDGAIQFWAGAAQVATVAKSATSFRVNGLQGLTFTDAGMGIRAGNGDPGGVVSAPVGTLYLNYNGGAGTTMYVKETGGSGSSGWVAK